jgi:phosphoribosylamine---glycine ligase
MNIDGRSGQDHFPQMRVLGIGDSMDLGALYLDLTSGGHSVKVCVRDPDSADVGEGLLARVADWRSELGWVREAGEEGIVVFETASDGALQDQLRGEGYQVIGGSEQGDRLESDRAYAQQVLHELGMQVAPTHRFHDFDEGISFVRSRPDFYVYKLDGPGFASTRNYVGQLEDGTDLAAVLAHQRDTWTFGAHPSFVLMKRVIGVEMGVGAYFNGREFLRPACLDWEHKRFFPGDLGELTGEMGTLVTYEGTERFFAATLGRMEALLREARYQGYINLNTIVNAEGIWPLEFTCRFGYPGYAILSALQREDWATMFRRMVHPAQPAEFDVEPGFAVGVVLTVPPFPYPDGYRRLSRGFPVMLHGLDEEERRHLHIGEIARLGDTLVTAGSVGYAMVVTGVGKVPAEAARRAYATARKVVIPNVRYRLDIGERFGRQDAEALREWGWFSPDLAHQ